MIVQAKLNKLLSEIGINQKSVYDLVHDLDFNINLVGIKIGVCVTSICVHVI